MRGDAQVIAALNEVLAAELTAINQYFLHARMCKNWGYDKIAGKIYAESIDEMKHASELTDRILLLEGIPNLQKLGKVNIGEDVREQLKLDLKLEEEAIPKLKQGIVACQAAADHTSREMLEKILAAEESHVDWLETQLKLIESVGFQNYLTQQIG